MSKFQAQDFKQAQAKGHIQQLPEAPVEAVEQVVEHKVIDSPEEFRIAIGNAQMDGADFIEVSDRLFKMLVNNQKTPALTYGKPGVKVYKEGTRAEIESLQNMDAESYGREISRREMEARRAGR